MDDLDGLTLAGDLNAMDDFDEVSHQNVHPAGDIEHEDFSAALDEQMALFEQRTKSKVKKAKPAKGQRRRNIKAVKSFGSEAKRAQKREAQRIRGYQDDDGSDDAFDDDDLDFEPSSPLAKRAASAPRLVIKLGGEAPTTASSTPSLKIKLGGSSTDAAVLKEDDADDNDDNDDDNDDNDDDDDDDDLFLVDDDNNDAAEDDILITKTVQQATVVDSGDDEDVDHHCRKLVVDPKVLHMNDTLNVGDDDGVQVNVNKPADEPVVRIAAELAPMIKPHQIGGVRFMWENCVGKLAYSGDDGYGCILAHAMGLGKTLQVVTFVEVFLRATQARCVVIITPVNTIGNWHAEFEKWLMSSSLPNIFVVSSRGKLQDRQDTVLQWREDGGVLLVGYEMMRKLFVGPAYKARKRKAGSVEPPSDPDDAEMEEALLDPGPDLVVCDEGHRIKNDKTAISQLLKKIRTRRRVVLTGSPLQNNMEEYWCMVDFVRPNHLGTIDDFRNMFVNPIMNGQCVDSTERDMRLMKYRSFVLQQLLATFVQRRDDSILRGSLPAKNEYTIGVRLSRWQAFLYWQLIEDANRSKQGRLFRLFSTASLTWNHPDALYITLLKARRQKDLSDEQAERELNPQEAHRRKQMKYLEGTMDPGDLADIETLLKTWSIKSREIEDMAWGEEAFAKYKYKPFQVEISSKFTLLIKGVIEEAVRIGDKVLVFSQSIPGLDLLEMFLSRMEVPGTRDTWEKDVHYFRLDGKIDGANRRKLIDDFNDTTTNDHCHLFLLSTRAGSLGINLTAANRVVILDSSWNPSHDSQAVCRVYRYGQSRDCHIYRFIATGTMEETIYNRQVSKLGLSARVVEMDKNPDRHFTADQLEELFTYKSPPPAEQTSPHIVDPSQGTDPIMTKICTDFKDLLTKTPFSHHDMLRDGLEAGLSTVEKDDAMKNYARERVTTTQEAKTAALLAEQRAKAIAYASQNPYQPANSAYGASMRPNFGPMYPGSTGYTSSMAASSNSAYARPPSYAGVGYNSHHPGMVQRNHGMLGSGTVYPSHSAGFGPGFSMPNMVPSTQQQQHAYHLQQEQQRIQLQQQQQRRIAQHQQEQQEQQRQEQTMQQQMQQQARQHQQMQQQAHQQMQQQPQMQQIQSQTHQQQAIQQQSAGSNGLATTIGDDDDWLQLDDPTA
eukprot:m.197980 g.197980  ORF g.197980 m.197980 type:complete len:1169 (-) comp17034_c0_seq1:1153-4659(-)